jgi:hypothetical protein
LIEQLDSVLEQLEMLSRQFAAYTAALEKLKSDTSAESASQRKQRKFDTVVPKTGTPSGVLFGEVI